MDKRITQTFNIGNVKIGNRIIRSATHEGMADEDGIPSDMQLKLYEKLASGGAGAIITGYAGINQTGKSPLRNMLMLDSDEKIGNFAAISEVVHKYNTPVFLQIAHCGRATLSSVTGQVRVAPSAITDKMYPGKKPKILTECEIKNIIEDFTKTSIRAEKAGFDGIQLHAAHGYLLAQFLSGYTNRRDDKWGGTTVNRFRIINEIIRKIKKAQPDFTILIKLNGYDYRKNGMRTEEAIKIAKLAEEAGCDGIEVSCGFPEDGAVTARCKELPLKAIFSYHNRYRKIPKIAKNVIKIFIPFFLKNKYKLENYNIKSAVEVKKNVSIPVIVVGGIHTIKDIENAVINKGLDAISMSRSLILEPDLPNKFIQGKSTEARCIKCNFCGVIQEELPLRCYYGKLPKV